MLFRSLTGIIVVSCVRQESLDLNENAAEQLEIIEAKQWFEERMYSENYLTGESEMLLYKEWIPRWSEAKLQQLSENKIVEVPLMFKKFRATIAQEVFKLYEETKDPRYLLVDIKLIIEKDSDTGEMKDLIREIIPSLDYLQSQDFDPACLFRADEFSGAVKYYTPDWQFVYAHIYENGEIVGNLVKAEPETRSAGGFLCYEIITVIPVNWYLNDMVDGDYITTTYQYSVSIECYYSSGAGGGGGGGNGNGNGSNFDQVGEGNGGGGGNGNGQNQTNQPQKHQSSNTDKLFKSNFTKTMITQVTDMCVPSIMGYVRSIKCNGKAEYGDYLLDYLQRYDIDPLLFQGVSPTHVNLFIGVHFNTNRTSTSVTSNIDRGYIVMTNVPSDTPNSTHCVLIVGYKQNGNYVYMDPEKGYLMEAPGSYFLFDYNIPIESCK